ncbi:MAG: zinc-binding dehydrogenase [Tunicatimonas sp.]|uniref:zinc-binding dehydrogenase n=1 Tax=Tunicatimonas sp. TaxID=1940096 RepID=UPI003C764866
MTLAKNYQKLQAEAFSNKYREVVAIQEVALEEPVEEEVLIKNHFAGVNASDVNLIAGRYFADAPLPIDLGFEFIGKVQAVGSKVKHLKTGDAVMGIQAGGGYREYVTLPAAQAIPVPEVSAEVMSMLTVGLAASIGLDIVGEMKSNETVLVTAAAGGTGHIAVQLAKLAGNHVIGTCGSSEKADLLTSLGCDRVINYKEEDVDEVLSTEYPDGINLVFENVGGKLFDTCVNHVAKLGRIVVCGFVSEYLQKETVTSPRIYHQLLWKSASIRSFLFSDFPEQIPTHLQKLIGLISEGKLNVTIDPKKFKGIDCVVEAMDYLYSGSNNGRVVVEL